MRLLAIAGIALVCLTLIGIGAWAGFERSHAAGSQAKTGLSIHALHTSHPNMSTLPVQEPPLP